MDTLGQDRKFTGGEIEFVEAWVKRYIANCERGDRDNLKSDIDLYIDRKEADREQNSAKSAEWAEDEATARSSAAKEAMDQGMSGEAQQVFANMAVIKVLKERLQSEYFVEAINEFKKYHVLRFEKTLQLIFYYFGVKNWQINEPGTNAICWKQAYKLVNTNFFSYIAHLDPMGPKPFQPPVYAMTKRLLSDLEALNAEDIDAFSLTLSLLLKFTILCLQTRVADVANRRYNFAVKRAEREEAIRKSEER